MLMFDKNGINRTQHPLRRLLKIIAYKTGITNDELVKRFSDYGRKLGYPAKKINHDRNNLRKFLNEDTEITIYRLKFVLAILLNLNIKRFSVTVEVDGKEETYHSDDQV